MRDYVIPTVEIIEYSLEDVIAASRTVPKEETTDYIVNPTQAPDAITEEDGEYQVPDSDPENLDNFL